MPAPARRHFPVSWDEIPRDARALAWRLASSGPFDALVAITRGGLVPAAIVACALTLVPIVTHGNVGFTQFGYRFSLDIQPLLFVILATVFARDMSRLAAAAAVLSIAICTYGVWAIGTGFVSF